MNKALAGISAMLMVFGMGLALWTHHEMQSRLAQESTTMLSANKAELYPAAMKSELEVARLSSNLGIVKAQGAEHLDELMLALDVAFSRHFLHSRGALYRPLMQQREYSTLMYQIGRHLELLENQIQRQDWSQAWVTQGDLSIAMNEVTIIISDRTSDSPVISTRHDRHQITTISSKQLTSRTDRGHSSNGRCTIDRVLEH